MSEMNSGKGLSSGGHYYAPISQIGTDSLRLSPDEARHAVRVLRLGVGDEIFVVDAQGGWYRACIDSLDRDGLVAKILERKEDVGEPSYKLTIGIGLLKQQGRLETFLEKAVELGVTRIVPLITERGQLASLNMKRCHRVLLAGLKQSLRSRIPHLTEPRPFEDVVRDSAAVRLIAHERASKEASILRHSQSIRDAGSCHILVGPEGGFSDREIEIAERSGWTQVSFGEGRLRTETAGIVAASAIQLMNSLPTRE